MASSRMYFLTKCIVISQLIILVAKSSQALLCLPCDESKCEEPKHCSGSMVLGICGCCSVCAKQKNENCGGVFGLYGTCDRGLRCVIRPPLNGGSITQYEVGVCEDENWDDDQLLGFEPCNENLITGCNIIDGKCECDSLRTCNNPFEFQSQDACHAALKKIEEERPDCSKARCEVQFSPRCPEDSVLIEGYAPPGECCPLPSRCVCSPAGCLRKVCQPGYLNILVSKGSGKPGECCDLYECKPVFSVDCSTVECPSVQQVQCPPDSYETQVRLTADGCCTLPTRCECLPGLCGLPQCSAGSVPRIIFHGDGSPGRCCDMFECFNESKPACTFNGAEYREGDMFRMDTCRFCRCQGGVSVCFSAQCGTLNCEHYYVPEGECCPVCEDPIYPVLNFAGCYVNGQILAHGDHWREDDCTFCQCVSGEARCVAAACGHSCINPVTVPGECCPVCEEPTYITMAPPACGSLENCSLTEKDCFYGFQRDRNDCRICQCKTREELCKGLIQGCTLDCPFGYQIDAHGCDVCRCRPRPKKCKPVSCDKECPFGFIKNKHGCDVCRCKKCPELPCEKTCPIGFQQDELGCLICQCKDHSASSVAPAMKQGSCLSMDGRRHENGESWHDGCRECYCHNTREMCALISCPVPVCASPTIRPGQCCPSCPDDPTTHRTELSDSSVCLAPGGAYYVEGETWSMDSCTQCACHSGRVLCETEVCPPLLCQSPIRTQDSCCPHCSEEPLTPQSPGNDSMPSYCRNEEGDIFLAAESWKPNTCSSCVCLDGKIRCFSESCPLVGCVRPVLRKGQCCPYCLEDTAARAVCHFNGKTYADEERWDIDSCTHCYCLQGQTLCSTVSCPALSCHEPINVEGSCCPMCSEMYVPTNVPIEKTDQRRDPGMRRPGWPTPSENDIMPQFRGEFGSLQMPYLDSKTLASREDGTFHTVAWVALPILMIAITIATLLVINQKKQWLTVPCYRTPTKQPTCLNNQLVYVDCQKGMKVQVDSSQRMLRIADPDSRYSGYYSMQKQSNLQADNFYQTA
ncbi:cysteine-rich motor neuron 1 protein isoform X1 [Anguilla anguilla]|uniref:cysteine-rich motor neuron 1 protein isoform X1 n=1 Tax=Anguilla anguilla TaxID=7936 RepID=UPI0015ABC861|nr:cysteine-rich motor neuron 1 protein isoform X1 [Anguilla anguilla]